VNKKQPNERDTCITFITLSLRQSEWDEITQLREEVSFTKMRAQGKGLSGILRHGGRGDAEGRA
jgi:type I restriction enzyme R subunit